MYITPLEHVTQSLERPASVLRSDEDFKKLLEIFIKEANEIEKAFLELTKQKDISTVTGIWLDYIGKILGLPRKGLTDEDYRKSLSVKIGINNSDGTPDSISEIFHLTTSADQVRLAEGIYCWGQAQIRKGTLVDVNTKLMLEDIRPVGVNIQLLDDTQGIAFSPAWEIDVPDNLQPLDISLNSSLERLTLFFNGSEKPLFLDFIGNTPQYSQGTEGFHTFEWEVPEVLELLIGGNLNPLQVSIDSSPNLYPLDLYTSPKGDVRTFWWEISKEGKTLYDPLKQLSVNNEGSITTLSVTSVENETESLYVRKE